MKVLLLHNRYRQSGGETLVASAEAQLLRENGVDVNFVEMENGIEGTDTWTSNIRAGLAAQWSRSSYDMVLRLCRDYKPTVAHVHNFWMRLSPSVHAACAAAGVPTIQTLHNHRLMCVNAVLLRNGRPCTDCLERLPWRGVVRRCYRNSTVASAAVASMIVANRLRQTWHKYVNAYISPSESQRDIFIKSGIPEERLYVKPHFVHDCGLGSLRPSQSSVVVFVGRLSPEKGVAHLLRSWANARLPAHARLLVVGDGPDRAELEVLARRLHLSGAVTFAGYKSHDDVITLIKGSRMLVIPSISSETFGLAAVEAYSCGRAVIASDLGALRDIVPHRVSGIKVSCGVERELGDALRMALTSHILLDQMGDNARSLYLQKYTPQQNLEALLAIYSKATSHYCETRRQGSADAFRLTAGLTHLDGPGLAD